MAHADSRGIRIRYELDGSGPPLVLLHGLGGSVEQMYEMGFPQALRNHHNLIMIDARPRCE